MIQVTEVGDLLFEVRFDERLRGDLSDIAGWGSREQALERILSDIVLGCDRYAHLFEDLPDDPFFEAIPPDE